jgi:hypothetical protein
MITKEQWAEVGQKLSNTYGSAELIVDGYNLTLQVIKVRGLKHEIVIYVDGHIKGEWITKNCEERRRFMRPKHTNLWSAKKKASMTKGLSKAAVKVCYPFLDEKFTSYSSFWPSFTSLKRHLLKNNSSISLVVMP